MSFGKTLYSHYKYYLNCRCFRIGYCTFQLILAGVVAHGSVSPQYAGSDCRRSDSSCNYTKVCVPPARRSCTYGRFETHSNLILESIMSLITTITENQDNCEDDLLALTQYVRFYFCRNVSRTLCEYMHT